MATSPTHLDARPIRLRPYQLADAVCLREAIIESQPELGCWIPSLHGTLTLAEIRLWIESTGRSRARGEVFAFAIVESGPDALLGGCGLNQVQYGHGVANLYYWVRRSCWRKGIATCATRLLAEHAFTQLGLGRVEIVMATDNHASRRVAEKAGAHREGILRNRIRVGGEAHDAFVFSLIPEDLGLDGAVRRR